MPASATSHRPLADRVSRVPLTWSDPLRPGIVRIPPPPRVLRRGREHRWRCTDTSSDTDSTCLEGSPLRASSAIQLRQSAQAGQLRRDVIRPALRAAGLPETFRTYDLRQSLASAPIDLGMNLLALAQRMDHNNPVPIGLFATLRAGLCDLAVRWFGGIDTEDAAPLLVLPEERRLHPLDWLWENSKELAGLFGGHSVLDPTDEPRESFAG